MFRPNLEVEMQPKPIFDTVRRLLGRGFSRSEVAALDAAIGQALAAENAPPATPPAPARPRRIGRRGIELIKAFEGCAALRPDGRVQAYPDPASGGAPWTIGWGSTGPEIGPDTVWTQDQCDIRFERDLGRYAAEVAEAIGAAPTSPDQFDALVSFHYNTGAIRRATLTRKHCAGDHAGAEAEFAKWVQNDGRVLRGLVRRRAEEAALYGRS